MSGRSGKTETLSSEDLAQVWAILKPHVAAEVFVIDVPLWNPRGPWLDGDGVRLHARCHSLVADVQARSITGTAFESCSQINRPGD